MLKNILIVLLLVTSSFAKCGIERWPVKTLTDADVKLISWQTIKTATVAEVTQYAPPPDIRLHTAENRRIAWEEKVVWQIEGNLVGIKEESDGDYHMVIADRKDPKTTMVVEVPDPDCLPKLYQEPAARIRWAINQAIIRVTSEYKHTPVLPIVVTGPGFYDYIHKQIGAAKNGFEIHPAIQIEADTDSAHHIQTGFNPCLIKKDCVPSQVGGYLQSVKPLALSDDED